MSRLMVEHTEDILTIRDADGRIRYTNPSFQPVMGYKQEEMIGETGFDLIHPEDRANVLQALDEFVKAPGARDSIQYRAPRQRLLGVAGSGRVQSSGRHVPRVHAPVVPGARRSIVTETRSFFFLCWPLSTSFLLERSTGDGSLLFLTSAREDLEIKAGQSMLEVSRGERK